MNKGQFSIEFIFVLAALLAVLVSVSIPLYRSSRESTEEITDTLEARKALNSISQGLNSTYSGFSGNKKKAVYWLPKNVDNIYGNAVDNHFVVKLALDSGDNTVTLSSDTILPGYWENRIDLENITIESDNRVLHETVFELTENNESPGIDHMINIYDSILERE